MSGLRDCMEILLTKPGSPSGVYTIMPSGFKQLTVYCDMATDGGGWTVSNICTLSFKMIVLHILYIRYCRLRCRSINQSSNQLNYFISYFTFIPLRLRLPQSFMMWQRRTYHSRLQTQLSSYKRAWLSGSILSPASKGCKYL